MYFGAPLHAKQPHQAQSPTSPPSSIQASKTWVHDLLVRVIVVKVWRRYVILGCLNPYRALQQSLLTFTRASETEMLSEEILEGFFGSLGIWHLWRILKPFGLRRTQCLKE